MNKDKILALCKEIAEYKRLLPFVANRTIHNSEKYYASHAATLAQELLKIYGEGGLWELAKLVTDISEADEVPDNAEELRPRLAALKKKLEELG